MTQERRTLAVDIDGVVARVRDDLDYANAEPVPGARDSLMRLRSQGWFIALHTARHFNHLETTRNWLQKHGIPYDHLIMGKPTARFYIDDRAVEFRGDWQAVEQRVGSPDAPAHSSDTLPAAG